MSENLKKDMLEKQKKYFEKLPKSYYMPHELMEILDVPYNEAKALTKNAAKADEGYSKIDIMLNIMGGALYGN